MLPTATAYNYCCVALLLLRTSTNVTTATYHYCCVAYYCCVLLRTVAYFYCCCYASAASVITVSCYMYSYDQNLFVLFAGAGMTAAVGSDDINLIQTLQYLCPTAGGD
jgi:hypothetical protein